MSNNRKLDDWVEGYLAYTDSSESPTLYREWVALSTIAAAMERKVWLELGLETFYPNLYVILVGPSGTRKGTAMKPAREIMTDVGMNLTAQSTTKESLAEQLMKAEEMEDLAGVNEELYTHSSVTIYNEEIAVLFKHNDPDLIMWLTDWHDCQDHWSRETKTQGDSQLSGVWVNLLGAMTPELVKAYLPETAIGGGLTGRILFVYSSKKGKVNPLPFLSEEEEALKPKLVHDLELIHQQSGEFGYTKEFLSEWKDWVYEQEKKELFEEPNLDPYINRRRAHALKLCMIVSLSEGGEHQLSLMPENLERVKDILERVERPMPKVFSGVGASSNAEILSNIAKFITERKEVTKTKLLNRFYKDVEDRSHLLDVIRTLRGMNRVKQYQKNGHIMYAIVEEEQLEKDAE